MQRPLKFAGEQNVATVSHALMIKGDSQVFRCSSHRASNKKLGKKQNTKQRRLPCVYWSQPTFAMRFDAGLRFQRMRMAYDAALGCRDQRRLCGTRSCAEEREHAARETHQPGALQLCAQGAPTSAKATVGRPRHPLPSDGRGWAEGFTAASEQSGNVVARNRRERS